MIRSVLSNGYAHIDLSLVGFLIFLTVFVGVVTWTFRKKSKEIYKHLEKLPLEDNGT